MHIETIKEKTVPKMLVAYALYHVDMISPDFAEATVAHFYQALKTAGVNKSDGAGFFAAYNIKEFQEYDYDVELWQRVAVLGADTEIIKFKEVPRAKVVYLTVGDCVYADPRHYHELFQYMNTHDYTPDGWPRETYLMNTASSTGYVIELQMPFFV